MTAMRVLLARPESPDLIRTLPLGLLHIAAVLRERGIASNVSVLDLRADPRSPEEIRQFLQRERPDVVGISTLTREEHAMFELARTIRAELPRVPIVVGGAGPSADASRILSDPNVDVCVLGEGEETAVELLPLLVDGQPYDEVSGISFRGDAGIVQTPVRALIPDLDTLPLPAWDLVDMERYFQPVRSHTSMLYSFRNAPVFTSRGCPYLCTYCHTIFGKRIRYRSPESVVREIETLVSRYGVKEVHLEDDSFNVDRRRAEAICDLLIERGSPVRLNFPNGIRADLLDRNLLQKMKKAGVFHMCIGIESGSARVQKDIKKRLNLQRVMDTIDVASEVGIATSGFFMLGFLDETEEEMLQTVDLACRSKLQLAGFLQVTPFPGTELFEQALERGFPVSREHGYDYRYEYSTVNLSKVDTQRFHQILSQANRRFYMNPRRILDIVRMLPNKRLLLINVPKMAWNMVPFLRKYAKA